MQDTKTLMIKINTSLSKSTPIALLGLRLLLAYTFFSAALNHWSNMEGTAYYFGEILNIPFPTFNAYLATLTEFAGGALLSLGFMTRYISIPLIITMLVAIFTAHAGNGFVAFKNIPENSFLFNESGPLGSSSGIEIYNAGEKIADVSVYSTGGMEMPVIYILMLLVLVSHGAGKLSLDSLLFKKNA